jgi:FAD/FMN-containing dehydrogenase
LFFSVEENVMKTRSYFYGGLVTTLNIIVNALTFGRYLFLEGRVRRGVFRNWARRFRYRPEKFARPTSEQEIIDLVKNSRRIRLFGSAHSFNAAVVADDTLISLDRYCGVIEKPLPAGQMAFKGGTRVRDVINTLLENNLAFCALPSHDAQSIAGILSTDVHGTGRNWGFVSECVVGLKIIDGKGEVHECAPSDDLFKAAIGGIGAVGIITEVVVQAVERFNVEQLFKTSSYSLVKKDLDRLLRENDHVSLYLFPFTDKCQISVWNRTEREQSFLGPLWEFVSISKDALLSAWFGNLMAYTGLLRRLSPYAYGFKKGTDLVLESNKAYNRTIYHLHQELEFTVAFDQTVEMCDRFLRLYEEMYSKELPYALLEVRFTPAGHDRTLIGAGRGRRSTWIDLICNDSRGFEKYYAAAEEVIKEIGGRPHLGKYCRSFTKDDLAQIHKEHFDKFLELMKRYDPDNKFANDFTRRLFGQ